MIALAEASAPYTAPHWRMTERDLALLWHGQRFPVEALVTTRGEQLAVVFRGRAGGGAGPDYRDAVIALPDGRLLHGDVELHLRSSDCITHGHHDDPNYARVVLHLVLQDDTLRPLGIGAGSMRTVAFERWLGGRAGELERWLSRPPLWQEPCQTAVERRGPAAVATILRKTGVRRFEEHVHAFRRELQAGDPEVILRTAIFDGLGYSQNRVPSRALAARVLPPGAAEATLLAAAGFLEEPPDAYARDLAYTAADIEPVSLPWRLWGLRPENHPQRRLVGGARLVERFARSGFLRSLSAALTADPTALLHELQVPAEGYWGEHVLLGRPGHGAALVGHVRAVEIAVNAVLPFFVAFADSHGRDDIVEAARSLYAVLPPGGDYGITRPVARALRSGRASLVRTAADQQALLYLFKGYCSRGRCLECPFNSRELADTFHG